MRPPSRRLAPQGQNHLAAGPRPSEGGVSRPGDPPPQPKRGRRPARETAAPHPPGGALHPGGGHRSCSKRSRARKRPQWTARTHPQYPLPTDNGTAAPRKAQTKRPTLRPAWGRQGRGPGRGDLSPPPATLARWRPTGPCPAPTAARQPRLHVYTPGGRAGDRG